jgi:hypothetical protein
MPAKFPEVIAVAKTTAKTGASNGISILADTASYFTTDGTGVAISAPGEEQEDVTGRTRSRNLRELGVSLGAAWLFQLFQRARALRASSIMVFRPVMSAAMM